MMLFSCKGLYFVVLTTFAYVGIFVYWQGYMHFLRMHYHFQESQNSTTVRSAQIPNFHKDDANIGNNNNNSNDNITWNKETRLDLIYRAMEKYFPKSKQEIDIVHGLGIGAVLEMEDPMGGRNFGCLETYFYNWTFTTTKEEDDIPRYPVFESFFEWLDFGKGKDVELELHDGNKSCPRSQFDLGRHLKFTSTQRARTEIGFDVDKKNGGRICNASFVVASHVPVYNGEWLMAWGIDRKIYLLDENWGANSNLHIGHATFFCGRPVLFAGMVHVMNGTIAWISSASGHYKPTLPYMRNFYEFLRDDKGVNVTTIEWRDEEDNVTLDSNWVETLGKNASYGRYDYDY